MIGQRCLLKRKDLVGETLLYSITLQQLRQNLAECGVITVEPEVHV